MKNRKRSAMLVLTIAALVLLIIDEKTAASGVTEGIDICLKVVLPSLFPFFIVTTYLNALMLERPIRSLRFLGKKLHIPLGCEYILPLGLTGGYPVGAKLIADLNRAKKLDRNTSQILLGYCNNAGPAFIFGIAGNAFASPVVSLALWLIHITSAVTVGFLLPKPKDSVMTDALYIKPSISQSVKNSISACVAVCGWIITFKILIAYLNHWFADFFQTQYGILITGILELSNGCLLAAQMSDPAVRFTIYAVFLAFGGLCVYLQTISVTESIGTGLYIHGKVIQTCISFILSVFIGKILFHAQGFPLVAVCLSIIFSVFLSILTIKNAKKVVENG